MYPSSLTDEVWSVIEPLLPVRDLRKGGRPRVWGDRLVLDSIFYVLRAGCQWRMVPHDLAPWWVAYRWYRSWAADGTWDTFMTGCVPGSASPPVGIRTRRRRSWTPSRSRAVRVERRAGSTWARRRPAASGIWWWTPWA